MALPAWQATIQDENGNVLPGAEIEVVVEATGVNAQISGSRTGTPGDKSNPFFAGSQPENLGFAQFYAEPGEYRITATAAGGGLARTWRFVVLAGTAATADIGSAIGEVVAYENDGGGNPVITGEVAFEPAGTTLESTKQGPAIKELFDLVTSGDIQWLGTPIGQPFPLLLHIDGVVRPPQNIPGAVFIELTAGLDGVGDYNEGLLINEDVDATAIDGNGHVDLRITAEINLPGSPAHGEIVNLINSEGRAIIAGETSGVNWADQHQRITGTFAHRRGGFPSGSSMTGAFFVDGSENLSDQQANFTSGNSIRTGFDSANSANARAGDRTLIKSQTGVFFFRLPNVVGD
jgi:hypothetical protein